MWIRSRRSVLVLAVATCLCVSGCSGTYHELSLADKTVLRVPHGGGWFDIAYRDHPWLDRLTVLPDFSIYMNGDLWTSTTDDRLVLSAGPFTILAIRIRHEGEPTVDVYARIEARNEVTRFAGIESSSPARSESSPQAFVALLPSRERWLTYLDGKWTRADLVEYAPFHDHSGSMYLPGYP
ncbi:MAG: hypothetical protein HY720_28540 [Planctomycetes bacterium]|nr:hypothetical protein [Planctomycetota bacterium]